MLPTPLRVLYVEDEPDDVRLIEHELQRAGFAPAGVRVDTQDEFLAHLDPTLDIVLSDFSMPRFNGLDALRLMTARNFDLPFIFISGTIGEETAVSAMQEGAADYLLKDRLARLGPAVKQALARWRLKVDKAKAEQRAARLAAIVETCSDAIIAKTLGGIIVSWNPAAERLFGYTAQEIIGQHIAVLYPQGRRRFDVSEDLTDMMRRLSLGEHIPAYETVRVRKDGRRVEVLVSVSPIRDANNAVSGASTIAYDISQRKRAERILAAEQAVAAILTECNQLEEVGPRILQAIGECFRLEVAALWTVDREANFLRRTYAWHAPWADPAHLEKLGQHTILEQGVGLPGRVWRSGETIWEVTSAAQQSSAANLEGEIGAGVRGAVGLPMRCTQSIPSPPESERQATSALPRDTWGSGEVMGVIEFFNAELRESDEGLLAALKSIASQIGQFCERRHTEHALRASELQFRQLANAMPQIVWMARADGQVTYFNDRWFQFTDCPRDQDPEQIWRAVVHPDDFERTSVSWMTAVRSGTTFEIENRLRDGKTGRYHWFLVRGIAATDAAGKVTRWYGTATDIDEQKRHVEELRISEERFRSLVIALPTAVYATDRTGRITLFNEYAVQQWGRQPDLDNDRWCGAWKLYRMDGSPLPHDQCPMAVTLREGRGVRGQEIIVERPDGSRVFVLPHPEPLHGAAGDIIGAVNILVDLTEMKKLEEQYRQAQKMEAIGRLAAGVAHDFNNLLTVINGYGEIMLAAFHAADRNRGLVQEILRAGERASALTRQLLTFSRQQVLCPQVLNLNTALAQSEKMLRRLIGEDIDLRTTMDPGLGNVRADPGQIEQVLLNLAVNARDAMPRGGKISIDIRNVDLTDAESSAETPPGPYVRLSVSDSGCGMDRATKSRIFEPFFTTKGTKGTGLGLATVFGIVKQSQGTIEVISEPGQGATFRLYFPRVADPLSLPSVPAQVPDSLHGTETILLAEDEDGVRSLIRHLLKSNGYTVLDAANGADAVRLFEQHGKSIDLLITDVVMPRMSGRQLADHVALLRPGIKVLYLSGYTDDAVVRHGVFHDQTFFLQKPFNPNTLARKVREVLEA